MITFISNRSLNLSVLPSTRAVKFNKHTPQINAAFVASSASVIGNVKIGAKSSVWYGAVIRGKYLYIFT